MKKIFALLALGLFVVTGSAHAGTRVLSCVNFHNDARVSIGICGVNNCVAEVTVGGVVKNYNVKRKKENTGALVYSPVPKTKNKCTFTISALKKGMRKITNTPSCAHGLKDARCEFIDLP